MNPTDFIYWLQGYIEIHGGTPNDRQWEIIKDHLKLVIDKKTPQRLSLTPHIPPLNDPFKAYKPAPDNKITPNPSEKAWDFPKDMKITC